jgi:DnaJ-class molecular chaperone
VYVEEMHLRPLNSSCLFFLIRHETKNEIKDAYRKMAMALHPDRNDGCEIKGDEFKRATEAYQVLSGE